MPDPVDKPVDPVPELIGDKSDKSDSPADESGSVDLADGDASKPRKKRGMRVPSDNVPRPQAASTSTPVVLHGDLPPPPRPPTDPPLDVDVDVDDVAAPKHAGTNGSGPHTRRLPSNPGDAEELADTDLLEDVEKAAAAPVADAEGAEELEPAEMEEVAAAVTAPSGPPTMSSPPAAMPSSPAAATPPPVPGPAASTPPAGKTPPPAPPPPARAAQHAAAALAAPKMAPPAKKKGRAWFEEIFDDDYLRTLPFLTPQATQREASFICDALTIKAGQQVLDVGCGYGRHAMELAARGVHVVGLHLSLPLLLRGADEAQRRGLTINFVHGDMRELTFEAQFDGAYCVFSTFGFFDDDTNKRVALNVARALKPGARLVVDVLNRDYVVADLPTRVWWEGDGCVVLEEVDFNYYSSRIVSNRQVVFEDGRQLEQEISIRTYSLHELGKLLHTAGFRVLEVSGGLAARGRFFGKDSRHLIVVAERRADTPKDLESTGTSHKPVP